ncbi:expressed unknown protein [Seminavis robusta]|uniref:SAP domain-containing protein n=1 Tax=Seminavis robusta TaxID=568900 RepID=A0A9N8EDQ4_9STRA|nr:expressed unknown protein [Seminavis robusta]|eukprot:Sro1026_g232920.1 n/a (398) ;mRNA; f:25636-26829
MTPLSAAASIRRSPSMESLNSGMFSFSDFDMNNRASIDIAMALIATPGRVYRSNDDEDLHVVSDSSDGESDDVSIALMSLGAISFPVETQEDGFGLVVDDNGEDVDEYAMNHNNQPASDEQEIPVVDFVPDTFEQAAEEEEKPFGNVCPDLSWNKLTVKNLKEELKLRGLKVSGRKAELVARLEASDIELGFAYEEDDDDSWASTKDGNKANKCTPTANANNNNQTSINTNNQQVDDAVSSASSDSGDGEETYDVEPAHSFLQVFDDRVEAYTIPKFVENAVAAKVSDKDWQPLSNEEREIFRLGPLGGIVVLPPHQTQKKNDDVIPRIMFYLQCCQSNGNLFRAWCRVVNECQMEHRRLSQKADLQAMIIQGFIQVTDEKTFLSVYQNAMALPKKH